jgi:polyhydroxyalkanoate synthesis regulator phasin
MTINEILHRALMAGLGVPEKMKELVDELVKKGELSESQGARLVKECTEKVTKSGEDISKNVSELIGKTLETMNIPTRNEVEELKKKLKSLSSKVKKLEEKSKTGAD